MTAARRNIDRDPFRRAKRACFLSRRAHARRERKGFTFVEILLAIMITALVMASLYGLLVSTVQVKEIVQKEMDEVKAGVMAFDLIRRDIRLAGELPDGRVFFKSDDGEAGGTNGAGRVDFTAAVRNRFPPDFDEKVFEEESDDEEETAADLRCDLCEIGYYLKEVDGEKALVRREDFYLDGEPQEGGVCMRLCRRVKELSFLFYAGDEEENAQPADTWDAEKEKALPFAVKVRLVIDQSVKDGEEKEKVFEAVVPLLAGNRKKAQE